MKKTIAIVICMLMLLGLTGCSTIESLMNIGRSIMEGQNPTPTPLPTIAVPDLQLNPPVATVPPLPTLAPIGDSAYPVLEAADLSAYELESAGNSTISAQFPAGEWLYDVTVVPVDFAIYDMETLSSDIGTMNINMTSMIVSMSLPAFTEELMDAVLAEIEAMGAGMELQIAEMRTMNGENLGYVESLTSMTDEMLDAMNLTDEQIEQLGGREVLLNIPPTYQVQMYYVVSGKMVVVTGTYYDDVQKGRLIETMTILLQTVQMG